MAEGEKPEWLTIDNNGLLSWTKECVVGTYNFKIKAFDSKSAIISESNEITLEVTKKSNIPLILGLLIGLGIPIILAVGFEIWYLIKKEKKQQLKYSN